VTVRASARTATRWVSALFYGLGGPGGVDLPPRLVTLQAPVPIGHEEHTRGAHTGPNPTDRGKPGLKRSTPTDGQGLILGIKIGPANGRDEYAALPLVESLPVVVGPDGAPRVPRRLRGDAGYGWPWLIALVAGLLVSPVLALRGRKQHGSGLGRT